MGGSCYSHSSEGGGGDGSLVYCLRWEREDAEKTPMEMTIATLKESVRGVLSYLRFTLRVARTILMAGYPP